MGKNHLIQGQEEKAVGAQKGPKQTSWGGSCKQGGGIPGRETKVSGNWASLVLGNHRKT